MAEWQEFEDWVHAAMLADSAIQERWSKRIEHPDGVQIAFKVKDQIEKYLSLVQRERIVELPDDWTPVQEEL